LARGTASESLLRKARQDLRSCLSYLEQHFPNPSDPSHKAGKRQALKQVRRLTEAVNARDAAAISKASAELSKAMIYLWALGQFRSGGGQS
jgi:hypothetical protein